MRIASTNTTFIYNANRYKIQLTRHFVKYVSTGKQRSKITSCDSKNGPLQLKIHFNNKLKKS